MVSNSSIAGTTPENTTARPNELHLLGMIGAGTSGYIEGMEAQGQRQLVASSTLPADGPWEQLTALGFKKGAMTAGDELFVTAELPPGWTKEGSDHAMWSYICDERGIRRVGVFYKAAFYDRRANMNMQSVGYQASTETLYGAEPVALPEKWELFTEDERADFAAGLDRMGENIAASPSVYGKYADRLAAARALLAGGA